MNDKAPKRAIAARERLTGDMGKTIERVWAPLAKRINQTRKPGHCFLAGLTGPQGSGKSTCAYLLRLLLEASGARTIVLSLDDFYLTQAERQELARAVHPMLSVRGPPGTHDIELLSATINRLNEPGDIALPAFSKALDDRLPQASWPIVQGGADIILFEGWCVGAVPQMAEALTEPVNHLERTSDPDGIWRRFCNSALEQYQPLFNHIDFLIQLCPPAFEAVSKWRREQEAKLRNSCAGSGPHVLSDSAVDRFVEHFERLTRHMLADVLDRADVSVGLGWDREVTGIASNRSSLILTRKWCL